MIGYDGYPKHNTGCSADKPLADRCDEIPGRVRSCCGSSPVSCQKSFPMESCMTIQCSQDDCACSNTSCTSVNNSVGISDQHHEFSGSGYTHHDEVLRSTAVMRRDACLRLENATDCIDITHSSKQAKEGLLAYRQYICPGQNSSCACHSADIINNVRTCACPSMQANDSESTFGSGTTDVAWDNGNCNMIRGVNAPTILSHRRSSSCESCQSAVTSCKFTSEGNSNGSVYVNGGSNIDAGDVRVHVESDSRPDPLTAGYSKEYDGVSSMTRSRDLENARLREISDELYGDSSYLHSSSISNSRWRQFRPLPLTALNHISIHCTSLERSIDFYCNVMGFVPIKRPNCLGIEGAWLYNHGIGLHLLKDEEDNAGGSEGKGIEERELAEGRMDVSKEAHVNELNGATRRKGSQAEEEEEAEAGSTNDLETTTTGRIVDKTTEKSCENDATTPPSFPEINPKADHVSYQCKDVDAVEGLLKARGVRYVRRTVEEGAITVHQLFFHDPDFHTIEVCTCDLLPIVPLASHPLSPPLVSPLSSPLSSPQSSVSPSPPRCRSYQATRHLSSPLPCLPPPPHHRHHLCCGDSSEAETKVNLLAKTELSPSPSASPPTSSPLSITPPSPFLQLPSPTSPSFFNGDVVEEERVHLRPMRTTGCCSSCGCRKKDSTGEIEWGGKEHFSISL